MLLRNRWIIRLAPIGCYYPRGLVRFVIRPVGRGDALYDVTCRHQRFAFRFVSFFFRKRLFRRLRWGLYSARCDPGRFNVAITWNCTFQPPAAHWRLGFRLDIAPSLVFRMGVQAPTNHFFVATFADSLNLSPAQQLPKVRQRGAPLVRRESRKRQNNGQLEKYPCSITGYSN